MGNIRAENQFVVRPMRLMREKAPRNGTFQIYDTFLRQGNGVSERVVFGVKGIIEGRPKFRAQANQEKALIEHFLFIPLFSRCGIMLRQRFEMN